MDKYQILVMDNEAEIRELIKLHLHNAGMDTQEAASGREAIALLQRQSIDLIILDLMMDDLDGWDVLRYLKASPHSMPIIALSALQMEEDKIEALDLGADDYVTKPFGLGELVARVHANLRRYKQAADSSEIRCGDIVLETDAKHVRKPSGNVSLSPIEADLLEMFMRHPGKVFTKEDIYRHVWKQDQCDHNTVSVYITYLRKKIEDDPSAPRYIQTIRGIGYRFVGGLS